MIDKVRLEEASRNVLSAIDAIVAIAEEENRLYADGLPAPPARLVADKSREAERFATWCGILNAEHLLDGDREIRESLVSRISAMREVLKENASLLDRARTACRFRVEAIMQVLREQAQPRPTAYGMGGMMVSSMRPVARPISLSRQI